MSTLLAMLAGALTWSLLEYVLHRWVMHTWTLRTLMREEHLEHHRKSEYYASAAMKSKAAAVALVAFLAVSVPLVGWMLGLIYAASVMATYLAYEAFHLRLHVRPPSTAFGAWARRHHFHHHHVDPSSNHGVTSGVWDVVFGSYTPAARVRIPAGKLPRWLAADEARYADAYDVVRREVEPSL